MLAIISLVLFAAALVGFVLLFIQVGSLARHEREERKVPTAFPRVSILKPLCGVDDGLQESLERFTTLDYPSYEMLLGVEAESDPAYLVARRVEARHRGKVRVIVQRDEPGSNPKVNQLIGLARASTGALLVISDSNSRAHPGFLREIAAHLSDPAVGMVAHPVVGSGEEDLGAALDNLHISSLGMGVVGAKRVAGKDFAIGKTMTLRKSDLEKLGGFEAVQDILAEDFVLCRLVTGRLGLKMAMAQTPVESVVARRPVRQFYARYCRWSVMHRLMVPKTTYLAELLLNPFLLAALGFVLWPSRWTALAALGSAAVRTSVDALTVRLMRRQAVPLRLLVLSPLKDLLVGAAWLHGLTHDRVSWRGHPLRLTRGTRLLREAAPLAPARAANESDEPALPLAAGARRTS